MIVWLQHDAIIKWEKNERISCHFGFWIDQILKRKKIKTSWAKRDVYCVFYYFNDRLELSYYIFKTIFLETFCFLIYIKINKYTYKKILSNSTYPSYDNHFDTIVAASIFQKDCVFMFSKNRCGFSVTRLTGTKYYLLHLYFQVLE